MTSTTRLLAAAGALALLLVASCVAAALLDDDGTRTALGAVSGLSTALVVLTLLVAWRNGRADRRRRDESTLDGLDPLGAARRQGR